MIFFFAVSLGWIAFAAGSVLAGASKRRDLARLRRTRPRRPARAARRRCAHRPGDADLQRGSGAHHRGAAGHGRRRWQQIGAQSRVSRSSCSPTRPMRMRGSARPRPSTSCAARSRRIMPVWYRRRWRNIARKSGNIEDFVTRWGGRYDAHDRARRGQPDRRVHARAAGAHDAGRSRRSASCRPRRSSSAHAPCSAGCSSSPPASTARSSRADWRRGRATAATTGATTRSSAWRLSPRAAGCRSSRAASRSAATCCRTISSRPRSCAAAAGRCAWPPISAAPGRNRPPSLIDVAIRDRRWAQGNLQHMKIIGARGLSLHQPTASRHRAS